MMNMHWLNAYISGDITCTGITVDPACHLVSTIG